VAEVPRVKCEEHGVPQLRVPWGEPGSRFTALFEALVIDWDPMPVSFDELLGTLVEPDTFFEEIAAEGRADSSQA